MEAPASICSVIHMGKELSSHVESRCYVVQLSLWPCLSTSPLVLWKSERNLSRKRKIRLCKIHFYLFFLFCACIAVGENSPLTELASGLQLLFETTSSLPAVRHFEWLLLALWSQLAQPAKLFSVHKVCVITEWGKTPYAWVLGFGPCDVQPYLMKLLWAKAFTIYPPERKKGLRKEQHRTFLFICF